MKKIFTIALVGIMVLSGCGNEINKFDAQGALSESVNRIILADRYEFTMKINVKIGEIEDEVNFKGYSIEENMVYLEGELGGFPIKVYQLKGEFFVFNPFTDSWVRSIEMGLPLDGLIETPRDFLTWIRNYQENVFFIDDAVIRGNKCRIVVLEPTKDTVLEAFGLRNNLVDGSMNLVNYTSKFYIGKRDLNLFRIVSVLNAVVIDNMEQTLEIVIDFYNLGGKNIAAEIPEELKIKLE
jgi:hypothetical protein